MMLQMANPVDPFDGPGPRYAVRSNGSRMTRAPANSSSAKARLASTTSSTASRKFARASSRVSPAVRRLSAEIAAAGEERRKAAISPVGRGPESLQRVLIFTQEADLPSEPIAQVKPCGQAKEKPNGRGP